MNGKEVAPKHEDESGDQGSRAAGLDVSEKMIGEKSAQEEMKDNDSIEGDIKREKKKKTVQRIEDRVLGIGKERLACELIGIPQGEAPLLQTLHPEESWRDEIGSKVPLGEEVSAFEEIIKEEEGGNKKGQNSP